MSISINGIAHIQLSVRDFDKACAFYSELLSFLEMVEVPYQENSRYWIGGKTGIAIVPTSDQQAFDQNVSGLHHFCFRLRSREDVDALYEKCIELGAKMIRKPSEGSWAEGYYSILFEDPEGIRIEANYVPGKGLLL
ncbi:MAG: VOC family protein [Bdellovibrionales bacterium]|nr:VOC family protein [Bdellovibrionales bacterium]